MGIGDRLLWSKVQLLHKYVGESLLRQGWWCGEAALECPHDVAEQFVLPVVVRFQEQEQRHRSQVEDVGVVGQLKSTGSPITMKAKAVNCRVFKARTEIYLQRIRSRDELSVSPQEFRVFSQKP